MRILLCRGDLTARGILECMSPSVPSCRFLGVPVPEVPFPQPQNEGSAEMLWQMVAFIWRHPLASVGLQQHSHRGPLTFEAIK